jgi:N-methylhydantoinase A
VSHDFIIGIDIGGTCTDCVVLDRAGRATIAKAFSTPPDFSQGIVDAIGVAAADLELTSRELLDSTWLFMHSTTVAENAMVDGNFSTPGLITTSGFGDTLFASRGGYGRWSGLTDEEKRNPIETSKPAPLVPRANIRTVRERVDREGVVVHPIDAEQLERAVRELVDLDVEAIGVCLLWSFANPDHEEAVREAIRRARPDLFVTVSHEIAPIVGEYERTSTVALNAGLGPVVARYLDNLLSRLRDEGFGGGTLVMQANGGLISAEGAGVRPVGMIESGPVSGLMGSRRLGERMAVPNIISADMGGTTFKVGVVRDGGIEYQHESMVFRYHYALPKVDIVSLGLAGGSVIWFDERTGSPRIGPRGAGSYPGPVVYGHGGTECTVTDVDAVLGFLSPDFFLGGRESLDIDAAREAVAEQVAEPLGRPLLEAAAAIYSLANTYIYDLLHRTTVQRGLDPRSFTLFSTGGTAGMHLPAIAGELGVPSVVIPHSASVHGAFGLVTSDVVHEEIIARPMREPADPAAVQRVLDGLRESVVRQLNEDGFAGDQVRIDRSVDMRYRRQVHEVNVPVRGSAERPIDSTVLAELHEDFESRYRERYGQGSTFRGAGVELATFRVRGAGHVKRPEPGVFDDDPTPLDEALVETRPVFLPDRGSLEQVPAYDFTRLGTGTRVSGPALIWSPVTTVVVGSEQRAGVDPHRNLVIEREAA